VARLGGPAVWYDRHATGPGEGSVSGPAVQP